MRLFRGFAIASVAVAFVIAVLGSWVRINDAGLTCPDWPLCHGRLVPVLSGGVTLEWSHRLAAGFESLLVLGTIVTGFRIRHRIAALGRVLVVLAVAFSAQIVLGDATVLLANSPLSVMLHWAMGMTLLATLTALALLAIVAPTPRSTMQPPRRARYDGAALALALASAFAFATMCAGAYVSSSGAGLACATVPTCDGTLWGTTSAQFAQMLHRLLGASFSLVALIAATMALQTGSRRVATWVVFGLALIVVQVMLGLANVVWHLPTELREAHAANAAATFLTFVIAALLAALEPHRAAVAAREPSLTARRIASSA